MPPIPSKAVLVVGAGPAGLTAAFESQSAGFSTILIEQDPSHVGGISRTEKRGEHRFDIGGHRFFSKSPRVTQWWKERLTEDFLQVRRMSRIHYRGRFFDYPLKAWNALTNLGLITSIACVASYVWARIHPTKPEKSFEDWVSNRFGRKLFKIFFKTYTEKVWGMSTRKLSADWAAQRIKGLDLSKAILNALFKPKSRSGTIKTLIDTFDYPRLGPGQMWETVAAAYQANGGTLLMGEKVVRLHHSEGRLSTVEIRNAKGELRRIAADHFILSMPLGETVLAMEPPLPLPVQAAARGLSHRDFITVALNIIGENPFPDNWIYIHDPAVMLGRIQNFRNWSVDLVGAGATTCLGLEYFCFEGDELWKRSDEELIELGISELERLGLVPRKNVTGGAVVKMPKAYPVYDDAYRERVDLIRLALHSHASNLQVVGRNGMHKYNNQDHSMMTAFLAVENIQGAAFNLWNVNSDAEYHEESPSPESGKTHSDLNAASSAGT